MKLLRNARIPHDDGTRLVDILYDEHIEAIVAPGEATADEIIEAHGRLTLPAAIDSHVHFNDPGYTEREDFASGTAAAAAGGVGTVVDMPCTSLPPVVDVAALETKLSAISAKAHVDYALWGGVRGGEVNAEAITALWSAGVVGFKSYTISGMDTFPALSPSERRKLGEIAAPLDALLAFHAEDPEIIRQLESREWNYRDFRDYALTRPAEAERSAVAAILAECARARMHIVHVAAASAAHEVLAARANGARVTWETAPHYLAFEHEDFARLEGRLKTAPPVKSPADRAFLRNCLADGRLDWVATDHAGCDWATGKTSKDWREVYNGLPGVQWSLPWLADEFLATGLITPARLAEITSGAAAKALGLFPRKGSRGVGADADFVILDDSRPWTADEATLLSLSKYSPFNGKQFTYSVERTIVRGQTVYSRDDGVSGRRGFGEWVRRISP